MTEGKEKFDINWKTETLIFCL